MIKFFLMTIFFGMTLPTSASASKKQTTEMKKIGYKDFRLLDVSYQVNLPYAELEKVKKFPIRIFIPIASSTANQEILQRQVVSPVSGEIKREEAYGNEYWYGEIKGAPKSKQDIKLVVNYRVRRRLFQAGAKRPPVEILSSQFPNNPRYLSANQRVPIDGKLITDIIKDLPQTDGSPLGISKAIYNFVLDHMEYKKTGTGWGHGDIEWACSAKYGNCTDFHALFISLARSQKIITRFVMGIPFAEGKSQGEVRGYHCWVEFYLPKIGWVPVDASEAKKNLAKREFYFGYLPADRMRFSLGRDIVLNTKQKSGPLNYFIFPLLESGSERLKFAKMNVRFKEVEFKTISRK